MDSIQKSCAFLNILKPSTAKKVGTLFLFGYLASSIQRITGLSSNARITIENTKTAESKTYRLSRNQRILNLFPGFLNVLELIHEGDPVNIDFSDFNGRQVLMFAKQTEEGRAIPSYFEFLNTPIKKGPQNPFIVETVERFPAHADFPVRFVFDRGFAIPDLIRFKEFRKRDVRVAAYGLPPGLVISEKPYPEGEPRYIVTSDTRRGRSTILSIYCHRFGIEEFFKDAKRIFGLEYVEAKNDSTFRILLWFVTPGMWCMRFFRRFAGMVGGRIRKKYKNGHRLGLIACWPEWIQYEIRAAYLKQIAFSSG